MFWGTRVPGVKGGAGLSWGVWYGMMLERAGGANGCWGGRQPMAHGSKDSPTNSKVIWDDAVR